MTRLQAATISPGAFDRIGNVDQYLAPPQPTAHTVNAFFDALPSLEARLAEEGRSPPFRLLVDMGEAHRLDAEARAVIYRRKTEVASWKIAVVGHSLAQRILVEFLRMATRLTNVKYFTDQARALAWLETEDA